MPGKAGHAMAKFVYGGSDPDHVRLEAEPGEELSLEVVRTWSTLSIACALEEIGDHLAEIRACLEATRRH